MNDVDALFGFEAYGANTGEKLFLEYEPDDYENRFNTIREHGVIAMFDRKTTEGAAFCEDNRRSFSLYLHICRVIATEQPYAPRFFFCIGGQQPPWRLIEIDITSGAKLGETVLESAGHAEWRRVWDALGLADLRLKLRRWITSPREVRQRDFFR